MHEVNFLILAFAPMFCHSMKQSNGNNLSSIDIFLSALLSINSICSGYASN